GTRVASDCSARQASWKAVGSSAEPWTEDLRLRESLRTEGEIKRGQSIYSANKSTLKRTSRGGRVQSSRWDHHPRSGCRQACDVRDGRFGRGVGILANPATWRENDSENRATIPVATSGLARLGGYGRHYGVDR